MVSEDWSRVLVVSKVFSAVSKDKSELDFEAIRGYHKMRRKENGI